MLLVVTVDGGFLWGGDEQQTVMKKSGALPSLISGR